MLYVRTDYKFGEYGDFKFPVNKTATGNFPDLSFAPVICFCPEDFKKRLFVGITADICRSIAPAYVLIEVRITARVQV